VSDQRSDWRERRKRFWVQGRPVLPEQPEFAMFYILTRPELRESLGAELAKTMEHWPATVPTWTELERLPLLQAILKESLR
jgi:hypothetical protein